MEINLESMLNILFTAIVIPIMPLLVIYIRTFVQKKISEIDANVKNEELKKYLQLAEEALLKATETTSQTYVRVLKEQGKFDLESQKVAFDKTKEVFLKTISEDTFNALQVAYGDYETWIKITIETLVKESK